MVPDADKRLARGLSKTARRPKKARIHNEGVKTWQLSGAIKGFSVKAMRYIDGILQPGEKVLFYGRLHWAIYFPGMLMLLPAIGALAMSARAQAGGPIALSWLMVALACAAAAGVMIFSAWFRRWTTEIDVTDRRIVLKRGFINRHTLELNMDKVESIDVDQSIPGRLLDYGDITVHGTGETLETICTVAAPLQLRSRVTAR
jgi:hypothetical protein